MADETFDEDIFDDLYDEEQPAEPAPAPAPAVKAEPEPATKTEPAAEPSAAAITSLTAPAVKDEYLSEDGHVHMQVSAWNGNGDGNQSHGNALAADDNYGPINVKEDG